MPTTDRATDVERLRRTLAVLVRRFGLGARAEIECCGTTIGQAAVLEILADGGPRRSGEIGALLGIDASTTTRNLDRLAAKGLVKRVPDPCDRRVRRIVLTQAGLEAAAVVEGAQQALAGQILDALPAASSGPVLDAVEALLDAIRTATDRCCPGVYDHLIDDRRPAAKECATCPTTRNL